MELTPTEAFGLLRRVSYAVGEAQANLDAWRDTRDALILAFDGQEGMGRTAMADAAGITRMAVWQLIDKVRPETMEEDVLLSDRMRIAIEGALKVHSLGEDESTNRLRLDVHA